MKTLTNALVRVLGGLTPGNRRAGNSGAMLEEQLAKLNNTGSQVFEPARMRISSNARRVALYMGSELPSSLMDYVIDVCAHLGYDLTVLTFQSKSLGRTLLAPYRQDLEKAGVNLDIVTLKGDSVAGLARYLRGHPEFAFLLCRDLGYLGRSYLKGTQRKDAMPVPVVVVSTSEGVSSKHDQAVFIEEKSEVNAA